MKEALQWFRKAMLQGHGSAYSRLRSFADTPECELLFPNTSGEERKQIIDEERRIASTPKRNQQRREEEMRVLRMCALPDIAP
jgi:TPR repeat protein